MLGDVDENGDDPDDTDKTQPDKQQPEGDILWWADEYEECRDRLNEHSWADDKRHEVDVGNFVVGEGVWVNAGVEGVVDNLHEPDDADHDECGRKVTEQNESHEPTISCL